ncbi:MAG: GntR family transcriptional regulator [Defluviitaleaceae bacterium]|nr:GntR family transcriptional regulator [Defluviitaleaceae bacterium]
MLYPRIGKPLFKQLGDIIMQMIEEGKYNPGDLLPSERELAEQYSISRVTVRQALNALAQDGVIFKKQGKGNFVATKRIETKLDSLLGFVEEFVVKGMQCKISIVKQGYEAAPPEIISSMQAQDSPEMFLIVRQIIVENHALGLDYTYIPRSVAYQLGEVDFKKVIICRLLEQRGYKLSSAEQSITADLPNTQECSLLEVTGKTPVLVRSRVAYAEGNLPLLYSRTVYRGDRYQYTLTLSRSPADDPYFLN